MNYNTSILRKFHQLLNYVSLISIALKRILLTLYLVVAMANLEDNVGKVTLVATGDGRIIVGKSFPLKTVSREK